MRHHTQTNEEEQEEDTGRFLLLSCEGQLPSCRPENATKPR